MSFSWPVRIYWEDTDAGGVVYYANYLKFMERARTEWLRSLGLEQQRLRESAGVVMVIRKVNVDFRMPARLDDALRVTANLSARRGASFEMIQEITREADGELLVTGTVAAACLDAAHWRPRRFPPELSAALDAVDIKLP